MVTNAVKILLPVVLAFITGFVITPPLIRLFIKQRLWKRKSRSDSADQTITNNTFRELHNESGELSTPRVGGIVIWASVSIVILGLYILSLVIPSVTLDKLSFLSRNQTLVPFAVLIFSSILGLFDDLVQIYGTGSYANDAISNRRIKIGLIVFISLLVSLWFVFKLGITGIHIPFDGQLNMGLLFIPFFILTTLAIFSSSVIDGIDGLAGGVMVPIFFAYAVIAYFHNQVDLAAFSAVVGGSVLVFLWFNVPPAKFYMGETGMVGLTVTLSVIAFLTDAVLPFLIIGFPLAMTAFSSFAQMVSYKYFNKKRIFLVAPIHHHFEAKGWSRPAVTMRYWIMSIFAAAIGTIITLMS